MMIELLKFRTLLFQKLPNRRTAPAPAPKPESAPVLPSVLKTYLQEHGDIQNYTNYRGIKLMNHTTNL